MTMTSFQSPPSFQSPLPTPVCGPGFARPGPTPSPAAFSQWLDEQERQFVHPKLVEGAMLQAGWLQPSAAIESARYRTRFNEHPLGYTSLLVSAGGAALALGTVGHLLAAGFDGPVNRNELGVWLTLFFVSVGFFVAGLLWAQRVDQDDPVAVWSGPRRGLSEALVWGCGIVGLGRLFWYGGQLVGGLVGATWAHGSLAAGFINVGVTVGIALPVGWWAYWFRHRFDQIDPTISEAQRRRLAH